MSGELASEHVGQIEAFQRRHRVGLLTLVFTDIVGSVQLKQELGDPVAVALVQRHHALVREVLGEFAEAEEIETAGDSFLLVFGRPSEAVRFALVLQARLQAMAKETGKVIADRVGIHLGEVHIEEQENVTKLFGIQVDTCARVMGLAQGGQMLMTRGVFDNARQALRGTDITLSTGLSDLQWLNHGPYLLKGLGEPLEVCEVLEAGRGAVTPPASSEKAKRVAGEGELVLGWRPALDLKVPGTQWVLEAKQGEGGFGEVWLARHEKLKEKRIFKFCFRADRARSLKREVTLFRLLKERIGEHPNIVKLYDVFFDEPPYYLVEEYVAGKDLASWCQAQGGVGQVPLETRLELVAQAADGLQAAHESGVIHRDIKPGNILVSSQSSTVGGEKDEGRMAVVAKLSDFGIGQVLSEEYLIGVTRAGFTQTILSDALSSSHTGTQIYMAPELLVGNPASTRSDIYSLGVVLYQMVVGDFARPVVTDWSRHIEDGLLREDLVRCFAGNAHERFGSAAELAKSLRALPERRAAVERQEAELARQQTEKAALERAAYRRGIMRAAGLAAVVVVLVTGLAVIALQESGKAKALALREGRERERAEKGEAEAKHLLYVADMNLVQQAWEQNNVARARQLLDETATYPGRGFEWYYWQRQMHLEIRALRGHGALISSVAFSPDGRRIATASWDHTVKVWDAVSGKNVLTLKGHSDQVTSVAFSTNGQQIVTASNDKTAKIWDAASGKELFTLTGHSQAVRSVAYSPDGRRIVTGSEDKTAKVWDAVNGKELFTLTGHSKEVSSVAYSPHGQQIVTGSADQTAKIWDAASGKDVLTLRGHSDQVASVAFSPNGRRIATASHDDTAKIWEGTSGKELSTLRGHTGNVLSVAFSPDGQRIVTGSFDKTARVWDSASGLELFMINGHSSQISSVAFSPDGQRIVTGGGDWMSYADNTARVWDAAGGLGTLTLKGHSNFINSVAFSGDSRRIVTGSTDSTARVWEADDGKELLTLSGHSNAVAAVGYSPDGQRIATGRADGTAKVWEAGSGRDLLTLRGHGALISSLAFSPDGQRIATGSEDQTARIWNAAGGEDVVILKGHSALIWSVAFSPNGQRVVTGSGDKTVKVWDAATGKELLTLRGHTEMIIGVAFSPDGRRIATGSADKTAKVWDAVDGKELLSLTGHGDHVWCLAFSPDGQRIVTGARDNTAKVWEAASGKELLTFKQHGGPIRSVAFSPDGRRIVTGSWDHTAKVWEAATPRQVAAWEEEERATAQYLVALERKLAAEQERQPAARPRDGITQWLVLAPISLAQGQSGVEGLDGEQIRGEGRLRPKAGEAVFIGGGELKWREVILTNGVIDFNAILGHQTTQSVAYAVCYIWSDAEKRGLQMLVGSDDEAKVYLNGRQVHRAAVVRPISDEEDKIADIILGAGRNVLVFKVVNESSSWMGSVRFMDAKGDPVKGIRVTLDPQARD